MDDIVEGRARIIADNCRTIAMLWDDAMDVADKLANPFPRQPGRGEHRQTDPVNSMALESLWRISEWLVDAATAEGMHRADAIALDSKSVPALARCVGDSADLLSTLPDSAQWADDATDCGSQIKHIVQYRPVKKQWRTNPVSWQPTHIARVLSAISGIPVKPNRIRQAAYDGRLDPQKHAYTLGEIADAIHLNC